MKIMILGAGELGKEFVIAAKRLGLFVVAVDNYPGAPAMQVADQAEVANMLDKSALDALVAKHKPNIIVPEIEAIHTPAFYQYEAQGIQVVPSARAADFTMNRKAIRELAASELGLLTPQYRYATDIESLKAAVGFVELPCVVKPLMSSSGKGQFIVKSEADIPKAWEEATTKARGGSQLEVIVEEFIDFDAEITLLTVTQKDKPTLFCPPIGHLQVDGDYRESWQPAEVSNRVLMEAQKMADRITKSLVGAGIWGVEFFVKGNEVYFSELSPRPHDTGMVTLAHSQNFNEFELHLRAILGLSIPEIKLMKVAASAVILAEEEANRPPTYEGLEAASSIPKTDFRIFGKPSTRKNRRMGVALAYGYEGTPVELVREKARQVASLIKVKS